MTSPKKFKGRLTCIVPGNFIGWHFTDVNGEVFKWNPQSYAITNAAEVAQELGVRWEIPHPFCYIWMKNTEVLNDYIFTFEKVGSRIYRIVDYEQSKH